MKIARIHANKLAVIYGRLEYKSSLNDCDAIEESIFLKIQISIESSHKIIFVEPPDRDLVSSEEQTRLEHKTPPDKKSRKIVMKDAHGCSRRWTVGLVSWNGD